MSGAPASTPVPTSLEERMRATRRPRRRLSRPLLAALAIAVAAAVAAAVLLTREPGPDLDLGGGQGYRTAGGLRELRGDAFSSARFRGEGTLSVLTEVVSLRDEPIPLSVPRAERAQLRRDGAIEARVGYLPTSPSAPLGGEDGLDLGRLRAAIPPRGHGVVVHRFEITNCKRSSGILLTRFPAATEGRPLRVRVVVSTNQDTEARDFAEEAPLGDPAELGGC